MKRKENRSVLHRRTEKFSDRFPGETSGVFGVRAEARLAKWRLQLYWCGFAEISEGNISNPGANPVSEKLFFTCRRVF